MEYLDTAPDEGLMNALEFGMKYGSGNHYYHFVSAASLPRDHSHLRLAHRENVEVKLDRFRLVLGMLTSGDKSLELPGETALGYISWG